MIRKDLDSLPSYVPGQRNERAVKLSSNEIAEGPLPAVEEAMAQSLRSVNRYPDMGAMQLREAIAALLGVRSEQVAVGTGSSALCQQLVTMTSQPGNEVVFPWRSFEAYPIFAQIAGATPVAVPLTADHRMDLPAMADAITPRTSLVFVCNPNNPTGTTITEREWADFMARVPQDVIVALDEAYFEYNAATDSPRGVDEIQVYPNVVCLRTFSKAYGLAGARVGYAFGQEETIDALNKVAVPFSVSSVAQVGALASLSSQDELHDRVARTRAQRERLQEFFAAYGTPHSEANFVWVPAESLNESPQELAAQLASHGVLVRAFDEGIRITVTNEEETNACTAAWRALDNGGRRNLS